MYLCVRGIDFFSFYDFDIGFWNFSNSTVFFLHFIIKQNVHFACLKMSGDSHFTFHIQCTYLEYVLCNEGPDPTPLDI